MSLKRCCLIVNPQDQIEQMKVLDLPCGEGAFTKRLLQKKIEVVPRDIVNILSIHEKRIDNFVLSDMDKRLPFDNELYKCKSPLNEGNVTPLHHKSVISFSKLRYLLHTNGFEIEKVRTNRIKAIGYLYILFYPFLYLTTSRVYSKEERDVEQKARNAEIRRAMFSSAGYFGETLIVCVRKK